MKINEKIKQTTTGQWLALLFSLLLFTDLAVLLNVPVLRESLSFLFFTLVPGFLVVHLLGLEKMSFPKKAVLSVGISVSILMFLGLFLNSLYPFLNQPLSLIPVLTVLNLITVVLTLLSYRKMKENFQIGQLFNFKLELKDRLLFPLIFPAIFPLMAIMGTYLMNTTQNNSLILALLFLIPTYLVVLAVLRKRLHPATYPLAAWLIGLSLLLMHSLTSYHIMGRDVHTEYHCFQLTLSNYHWDMQAFYNPYNACLSITILPTIYQVLSGLNPEYVFKVFFAFLGSSLPVVVYLVSRKFMKRHYAFYVTLLFAFQTFFINITGCIRQEVAILFFLLAVLVFFQDDMNPGARKGLFLLFVFSTVLSHYATSYVAFGLLASIMVFPFLKSLVVERKINLINFDLLLLYLLFIILWFLLVAKVQFLAGSEVATTAVATVASDTTNIASREVTVTSIFGIGLKSVPNLIAVVVNDLIFLAMGVGLLTLIWKYREFKTRCRGGFVVGIIISIIILALFVILPFVSFFYGSDRLFFQLLVFTGPLFILGCVSATKVIKKPSWKIALILMLLISLFFVNNHLQYHFYGIPYSSVYDKTGIIRGEKYIYNGEIATSQWLSNYRWDDVKIYSDAIGFSVLGKYNSEGLKGINFKKKTISGYLYLGYVNIREGKFFETLDRQSERAKYPYFFQGKSLIYQNGYSEVWL
ncbi:MAG: hypothetical protein BME94_01740 [Methanobacteriales archaeon Met13]